MEKKDDLISLKGGDTYITEKSSDAFIIAEGSIFIYIAPLKNGKITRRAFVYQAEKGEVFPAFSFTDQDYCSWRFCFSAVDKASFRIIENGSTKLLKENFAKKACIKNFSREGYEGSLVDQYRLNIVTEDGFIRRTQHEREKTVNSIFSLIAGSFGKKNIVHSGSKSSNLLYNAMSLLCKSQNVSIASYDKMKKACGEDFNVSDIARISRFSYREIVLEPGWSTEDGGSFIAFNDRKKPVVCMSKGTHSYFLWDVENGCSLPCTKKTEETLKSKAYMIYVPLPDKALCRKDLFRYCIDKIKKADILMFVFLTVITSVIGILTPVISRNIYDKYIPLGDMSVLFQLGSLLASFMIANIMFSIVKNIMSLRISSRMAYNMQSAVYNRLFSLPESFFRKYEFADLGMRVMSTESIVRNIANVCITSVTALVVIAVHLIKMFGYSARLTLYGCILTILYGFLYYLISFQSMKHKAAAIRLSGITSSKIFQFLNGIAKIRIAGVEDRALYEYFKPYIKQCGEEEKKEKFLGFSVVLKLISGSLFSVFFYILIVKSDMEISLGEFISFNSLFGSFCACFLQLMENINIYNNEKPNIERLKPVFQTEPELDSAQELPGNISGGIEINNVMFSYDKDGPVVLNGISLDIKPGEYIGIAGSSGCGKSTFIKLLLGFEKPDSGKIYYDNKDIESIDKRELRKKMGVVLQNGKLISGSIYENITITAPDATVRDVNAVIEAVGLKKDISAMPMGLYTVLSEDCDTISGGQKQRILIARAIISNPKILIFDEATSALDNITQSVVCDTMEKMKSTRIVIAHRLSTIINCDRIIVLDNGKIAEQGTYEELMNKKSLFYSLASRQMLSNEI